MPSQGPNSGSTATSEPLYGTGSFPAWSSPSNVFASDNANASISGHNQQFSQYLVVSNFGFAIPNGSRINGILVEIERRASVTNAADTREVWLTKNLATIEGGLKGDRSTKWGTTDEYTSWGSLADLWGATWNPADINSSLFGVAIMVEATSLVDVFIDHVRVIVDYALPGNPNSRQSQLQPILAQ